MAEKIRSISFVDLKAQYESIKNEIDDAIQSVINETAFVRGKYVEQFENAYAEKYGIKHCISCANGTDAIYISLKALGIGPGDEVITVANSWISTSETITQAGAKPVFVDIEPEYYNINPELIEEKITERTKAIIPVHLYGQPAQMDKIMTIANNHDLKVIEDCAQAHFAEWNNQKVGTFGIAGTFSFYPGKNMGAYGDAGCIVSNDDEFARKARMFANHGALKKHEHEMEGINSRLDGIQAAVLLVKLKYILQWNEERRGNAEYYSNVLGEIDEIIVPKIHESALPVFHLYVIRTKLRNELKQTLKENGISTGIHYPTPLPFLEAYQYLNHSYQEFPVAYKYKDDILSLPMYPELSSNMIDFIMERIRCYFEL